MNEAIKAILYSACGGLLFFFLQDIYIRIKKHFLSKATYRFWEFGSRKIVIVYPLRHSPDGVPLDEDPNRIHTRIEDVIAIVFLISFFNKNKIEYLIQDDSVEIQKDCDVVLLCSPKGNKQSASLVKRVDLPFEIVYSDDSKTFLYHEVKTGQNFESLKDKTGKNVDISLIARFTNTIRDQKFFLFWGVHGAGTLGAVKFAVNPQQLASIRNDIREKNFALIIEAPFSSPTEVGEPNILRQPQVF